MLKKTITMLCVGAFLGMSLMTVSCEKPVDPPVKDLTLLSPKSGTYAVGATVPVTFTGKAEISQVIAMVSLDDGRSWSQPITDGGVSVEGGTLSWVVGSEAGGDVVYVSGNNNVLLKIQGYQDASKNDVSGTIVVTNP